MDNFIVSARKYRPQNFKSVIGQSSITNTLKNAISKKQIAHAYLFCGPRGIGKTTVARIFAKTINCQNPGSDLEACNNCESCKAFNESRSYNIHELDAASNNKVDHIRNLIDQVRVPPQIGKYSIYIIDEVHMLSAQAFNAFLKTLEEPPSHAIFVLATTEKHKILPTILSRCQIYDFNRIRVENIVKHLAEIAKKENVNIESESLNVIAQKADGAMRDALSIFDQMVSYSGKEIHYETVLENLNVLDYDYYFELTQNFIQHDVSGSLLIFDEILAKGFDEHNFIIGLSNHFRDLLVCKDEKTLTLFEIGASIRKKYLEQTSKTPVGFLYKALDICSSAEISFKSSKNHRLHVELMLIKLCMQTIPEAKNTEKKKDIRENDNAGEKEKVKPKEDKIKPNSPVNVKDVKPKYKPSTLSIGGAINGKVSSADKKEENKKNNLTGSRKEEEHIEDFGKEKLVEEWLHFAEMVRKEKPRMATTLKSGKPLLKDNFKIEIEMSNSAQKDDFNQMIKKDLTTFLRSKLKNDRIKIVPFVSETKKEKTLYTDEDKYKYMAEKNPNIRKLKERLNLDFK